jgi:hypothetical protein
MTALLKLPPELQARLRESTTPADVLRHDLDADGMEAYFERYAADHPEWTGVPA